MRRRAVIDAAADLFLTHGYGETTISAVAAAAEVSAQLVYASFGGKAGLLSAVVDVLVGGDDEPVLLRDRPDVVALSKVRSKRELAQAAARISTGVNTRVGPMLHLIDSVAGSDTAVAELRDRLVAFQQEDCRRFAEDHKRFLRRGLLISTGRRRSAQSAGTRCGGRWSSTAAGQRRFTGTVARRHVLETASHLTRTAWSRT